MTLTLSSHLWAHSVCRRLVRPLIEIIAKGQVGLQLKPKLRAHLSYANSQAEDERVYVLGVGAMANLFAHSLAEKPSSPPITLLWHDPTLVKRWEQSGKRIEIKWNSFYHQQSAFGTEVLAHDNGSVRIGSPIKNLIVCTKNGETTEVISRIKHRLNEQSTILFAKTQSLGIIEEVTEQVFPNIESRPTFLTSIVSHGVRGVGPFHLTLWKSGTVSLGVLPRGQLVDAQKDESNSTSPVEPSRYLIQQILDTPTLAGKEVSATEIVQQQMKLLVLSAMTHPLSAIFMRRYSKLFDHPKIQSLMQLLLREASRVLRALPELQKDGGLDPQFSPESLELGVVDFARSRGGVAKMKGKDIDAGKTELSKTDYFNGYLVKKGEQLGIDCLHNRTLVTMLNENRIIKVSQINEFFPSSVDPKPTGG